MSDVTVGTTLAASSRLERLCTYCDRVVTRIWSGEKMRDGSRVFVDDTGRRWAGKRCPDCERSRVNAAVRMDLFNRGAVLQELRERGYEAVSQSLPLRVRHLESNQIFEVVLRRATKVLDASDPRKATQVLVDGPVKAEPFQVVVLVFETARVLTSDDISRLGDTAFIETKATANKSACEQIS